jgi:UDP-N-acetylmuramate: L-alanyl-gamma-D-glutamyl-meso-diaminopimelate ligase
MSTQLAALGIALTEGYEESQLDGEPGRADLFVVGNAIRRGTPLIEAILDRGLPYTSGPEWLRDHALAGRFVLAVAGTHGKTTTAAMLAWILEHAGLAPGFLIGGVPLDFGVSARHSPSAFFVVEADEYDTAFFDKRSKFVHYRPRTVILNNLEFDHADIFPDLAAIETQFHHLVRTVPGSGKLVVNAEEASLARVLERGCWSGVERFAGAEIAQPESAPAPDWRIGTDGKVTHAGAPQGHLRWPPDSPLTGRHNRLNALAAMVAARHAGVPVDVSLAALASFRGVRRRMELRGVVGEVAVYDDFAHHPTAIATTVAGLRRRVGAQRIVAVLEPRSNTMKLGAMKAQLPRSLAEADHVFCYARNLGWDASEALAPLGYRFAVHDDLTVMVEAIASFVRPGDHVLVMSNGGFGDVHAKLLARLADRSRTAA